MTVRGDDIKGTNINRTGSTASSDNRNGSFNQTPTLADNRVFVQFQKEMILEKEFVFHLHSAETLISKDSFLFFNGRKVVLGRETERTEILLYERENETHVQTLEDPSYCTNPNQRVSQ